MTESEFSQVGPVFFVLMVGFAILLTLFVVAVTALIFCKIFAKAGFHWALGLLTILPFFNLIMQIYLAFADWPIYRELRQLRQQSGETPR